MAKEYTSRSKMGKEESIKKFENIIREKGLTKSKIRRFQNIIYQHYKKHGRTFPWRETYNPYHILVSEIMLQQTQVERVTEKYEQFITAFPDFLTLAKAPLRKILKIWQGLGYNRRALALKKIAQTVVTKYSGKLPYRVDELVKLPGIGNTTASEILVFAFNIPTVFIETNIRSVFIHFFFRNRCNIIDAEILSLVEKTLDVSNPRRWYYALMDYGTSLKKLYQNPNRKSLHYRTQSPFNGSNRQIRGMILKILTKKHHSSEMEIVRKIKILPERVKSNLINLEKEGFIIRKGKKITII